MGFLTTLVRQVVAMPAAKIGIPRREIKLSHSPAAGNLVKLEGAGEPPANAPKNLVEWFGAE